MTRRPRFAARQCLAVVLGAVGVWVGFPLADPIIGLVITITIFGIVWQSAKSVIVRVLDGVEPAVIDEIQHLNEAYSGGANRMLNFFVQLVNTIWMPVVLVGTPKAQAILTGEFRQALRGAGRRTNGRRRLPRRSGAQHPRLDRASLRLSRADARGDLSAAHRRS